MKKIIFYLKKIVVKYRKIKKFIANENEKFRRHGKK